jgi:hypothetical protein
LNHVPCCCLAIDEKAEIEICCCCLLGAFCSPFFEIFGIAYYNDSFSSLRFVRRSVIGVVSR